MLAIPGRRQARPDGPRGEETSRASASHCVDNKPHVHWGPSPPWSSFLSCNNQPKPLLFSGYEWTKQGEHITVHWVFPDPRKTVSMCRQCAVRACFPVFRGVLPCAGMIPCSQRPDADSCGKRASRLGYWFTTEPSRVWSTSVVSLEAI